jgi:hypothetical protein
VTKTRAGQPKSWGSIPDSFSRVASAPQCSHRLWAKFNFLSNGYQKILLRRLSPSILRPKLRMHDTIDTVAHKASMRNAELSSDKLPIPLTRYSSDTKQRTYSSSFCYLNHSPVTSTLLGPNVFLRALFSNTLSPRKK